MSEKEEKQQQKISSKKTGKDSKINLSESELKARNSLPKSHGDGTKETIRNRKADTDR